jgi:hypothetical protein
MQALALTSQTSRPTRATRATRHPLSRWATSGTSLQRCHQTNVALSSNSQQVPLPLPPLFGRVGGTSINVCVFGASPVKQSQHIQNFGPVAARVVVDPDAKKTKLRAEVIVCVEVAWRCLAGLSLGFSSFCTVFKHHDSTARIHRSLSFAWVPGRCGMLPCKLLATMELADSCKICHSTRCNRMACHHCTSRCTGQEVASALAIRCFPCICVFAVPQLSRCNCSVRRRVPLVLGLASPKCLFQTLRLVPKGDPPSYRYTPRAPWWLQAPQSAFHACQSGLQRFHLGPLWWQGRRSPTNRVHVLQHTQTAQLPAQQHDARKAAVCRQLQGRLRPQLMGSASAVCRQTFGPSCGRVVWRVV